MVEKYVFGTSFDGTPGASGKRPTLFTAEEMAAARAEARAEGEKAGRAAATADRETQAAAALVRLAETLESLGAAQEAAGGRAADNALQLAGALTRKVLPRTAERNGLGEIEALLRETLESLLEEPRVVIRVAEQTLDPLRARIDGLARSAAFPGQLVLLGDPALGPGDCRVEWADGGAERDGAALLALIDEALARAGLSAAAPAPRPTPAPTPTIAATDTTPTAAPMADHP